MMIYITIPDHIKGIDHPFFFFHPFSASILFNCLDSDCKQLSASPSCSSYTNAKQKIRKIFLNKLNLTNNIQDLFCINCKYLLNCNCIHY
jgi:hypothetical protein